MLAWQWKASLRPASRCLASQDMTASFACVSIELLPAPVPFVMLPCPAGLPDTAAALQAAALLGRHPLAPSSRVLHYVGAVGNPAAKIR